jgi:hypothetical protein
MSEGSRKIINGQEFFTRHNFNTAMGNVMETVEGSFILSNGELAKDKTQLELLPEQYRVKALKWWEDNFGVNAKPIPEPVNAQVKSTVPTGPTTSELLVKIELLAGHMAEIEERLSALEGVKSAKFSTDESAGGGKRGK